MFTTSHDEYILRKYKSNQVLSGSQKLSQEALCDSIAQKLKVEPMRVKHRLLRLSQSSHNKDGNLSETNSYTTSSRSTPSTYTSNSTDNNSPLGPRTANRYTESEDMAIYTAYLSNSAESKRKRALDAVRKFFFFVSIICVYHRILLIWIVCLGGSDAGSQQGECIFSARQIIWGPTSGSNCTKQDKCKQAKTNPRQSQRTAPERYQQS